MMKKFVKYATAGINVTVLCAMVGTGSFYWQEAQAEQRLRQFTEEDVHCLQQNIYFEARNQSILGQRAVAWVTLNRMADDRYPDTVCGVVWQPKQFSWTHDGKPDRPAHNEQAEWEKAEFIARSVMRRWAMDQQSPVEDADHYHADYVTPNWADQGELIATVDNHLFYRVKWQ